MQLIQSGRFPSWLLPVLLGASLVSAQSLQHRQPAAPPDPPTRNEVLPADVLPQLAAGTAFQVETQRNYRMKAGETIEGRLVYPLYANGRLAVPANTVVHGIVVSLAADRKRRMQARLHGDFTPFHSAQVRFDQLILPDGALALPSAGTSAGAPVIRLTAPGLKPHSSFIRRAWDQAKQNARDRIAFFTAPGRGDRALQMLYGQLPYHPERIPAHTAWEFELDSPLSLPQNAVGEPPQPVPASPGAPEAWSIAAVLTSGVTSATAKPGDPVEALVVEPALDKNGSLVVPQGSTLVGKVTTAKSARSLGRNGKLRFTFQQIKFPAGGNRDVEGALAGANTQGSQSLSMDAEGTVTPKSKSSVVAPLLLTMLAGRALDQDGNFTAQATVSSNGFGFIGRIVGIAAGDRNLAAGIGFYAAALSTYENFLTPGQDVDFPRDTRIEIQTTPLRAPVLKPEAN